MSYLRPLNNRNNLGFLKYVKVSDDYIGSRWLHLYIGPVGFFRLKGAGDTVILPSMAYIDLSCRIGLFVRKHDKT